MPSRQLQFLPAPEGYRLSLTNWKNLPVTVLVLAVQTIAQTYHGMEYHLAVLNLNDHPPNSDESDGTQPSCVHCTHWQYLDPCTTLWDFSEPDWHQGECNQPRIERRWPNPQAVIDAAQISFEHKLAVIAQQCPLYSPAPKTK
jgi:hypothetical protein